MQTFTRHLPMTFLPETKPKTAILLDIETTGLSPDLSTVFLIGCGYHEDQCLHTIHWLADTYDLNEEQSILNAFTLWLKQRMDAYTTTQIITYNGQNFDLPFLKRRFEQCGLIFPLNPTLIEQNTDYFRCVSKHKHLWPLKDLKLHTFSKWLGQKTSNTPSGRQLIKTYHAYIKTKDPALLNLLFLHNIDDLKALSGVMSVDSYFNILKKIKVIQQVDSSKTALSIHIILDNKQPFPAELHLEKYNFRLNMNKNEMRIQIPVYPKGLRYYYTDIKNYVYLPEEDYVLHKSMAKYMNKNHWIKATSEICYTWFIPDQTFFTDFDQQKTYIQMILQLFGLS